MLTAIRNWVIRTMMKAKGETGIVKTLPKKEIVDINTQITAQRLMENGINPESLKNADQVENAIIAIENRKNVQTGFTTKKSADVFDLEGKKIDTSKGIMGGRQIDDLPPGDDDLPPPGSRGGDDDIAAPFQSAEESIKNMIEAENKKNISKMRERKNREDVYGIEDYDTTNMSEIKQEIIKTETKLGNLNPDAPDFKEKAKPLIDKITALQKKLRDDKATGGRAGFANGSRGLLDLLDIQASGSKSGKQQIKGAPDGFTIDSETYNFIVNADIPINEKISLLTKYGRDKGRDKIEKDGQELFLGEGGSRIREIGLDINPDAERGFSGNIMYDPDSNNVKGGITYKFAEGGRIGFSKGSAFKTIFDFLNKNNPVQAYKKYLQSVKTRMQQGKEAEVAGEVIPIAAGGALLTNQLKKKLKKMNEEQKKRIEEEAQEELRKDMKKADGGRIGLKDGMDRRTFMKIMAGITALPVLGKFFKSAKVASKAAPIIKTPNAPGKPEWFDALVTKVVNEGTDVTKGFATKERELVHTKQINDFAEVTVYRDLDTNTTIVNYGAKLRKDPTKPYEKGNISRPVNDPDQIDLVVKGAEDVEPTIIENERGFVRRRGTKSSAEFEAYESEPRVVNYDGDMEFDGTNVVNNVDDLNEDVSVLKEYATGKKLTPEEAAKAKKKREDYQKFLEDPVEQANYLENKYGPGPEPDDFASGGIARMLGE